MIRLRRICLDTLRLITDGAKPIPLPRIEDIKARDDEWMCDPHEIFAFRVFNLLGDEYKTEQDLFEAIREAKVKVYNELERIH